MSDPVGGFEAIKKRLTTHIEAAMGNIGTVEEDWDDIDWAAALDNLPIFSTKVTNVRDIPAVFGRRMTPSAKGDMRRYFFNIHIVASACAETDESKYRYAHQHSDTISKYLRDTVSGSPTEASTSGIWHFEDITARESTIGAAGLARVIVEGTIEVKYLD